MSVVQYMRHRAVEALLVVLGSWCVCCVGVHAFFLDSMLDSMGSAGRAALCLVLCAVLVGALYAVAWQRRRLGVGIAAYVVLLAALVAAALALSGGENPYEDAEGNFFYFAVLLALCPTAAFLLARTLAGSVVWFVATAFSCSLVQAFYASDEFFFSIAASLLGLALIVNKNVALGAQGADVAKEAPPGRILATSTVPVALVGALALGAWFGIIAPMDPGVAKITLVTEYRQLPIQELRGTAEEYPVLNFDMTTQNLVEGFYYTTDDLLEDPNSPVTVDAASMLQQQLEQEVSGSGSGSASGGGEQQSFDQEAPEETYDTVSYSEQFPLVVLVLALLLAAAAAVVAYFALRRVRRRERLVGYLDLAPRQQVENIYAFLLSRLERIGLGVPAGATLAEFAGSAARQMAVLDSETHVPFAELTEVYQECAFGRREPTEEDVVAFAAYYLNFWKAARAHLGSFKYFFKSFRL